MNINWYLYSYCYNSLDSISMFKFVDRRILWHSMFLIHWLWSTTIVFVHQCRQWSSSIVVVRQHRQWSSSIVNVVNDCSCRFDCNFCRRSFTFVNVIDRQWFSTIENDLHWSSMSSMIIVVVLIITFVVDRCRLSMSIVDVRQCWLLSFVIVVDRQCRWSSMIIIINRQWSLSSIVNDHCRRSSWSSWSSSIVIDRQCHQWYP